MKVALYARVSTANNGQDPTMQTREMCEFCERRGWQIVEQFTDTGVSGSKDSRPGLNRLLADARHRKFDAVLVYRYDRFARSLRQLVNALGEFEALGIHFISLHEGVDTSTPNGRLVFGIFASIAEFERELIRSRVRSGLAAARAKGRRLGRPRVKVDAQQVSALRKQGASWATICRQTGLSRGTAQRALLRLPKNLCGAMPETDEVHEIGRKCRHQV
jgi:DNA invertase Pin-like site-specific DNA recombinase